MFSKIINKIRSWFYRYRAADGTFISKAKYDALNDPAKMRSKVKRRP